MHVARPLDPLKLRGVLDKVETDPLSWNPHAGDEEIVVEMQEMVQRMASVTGRGELTWRYGHVRIYYPGGPMRSRKCERDGKAQSTRWRDCSKISGE